VSTGLVRGNASSGHYGGVTTTYSDDELIEASRRNLGYLDAIGARVNDPDGADHDVVRGWVGSALFWLIAIDGLLRDVDAEVFGGRSYLVARGEDVGGQTLQALKSVRDEVAHGVALAIGGQGMVFPMFPDGVMDFGGRWADIEVIRDSHAKRKRSISAGRQELYVQFVADKMPWTPVSEATGWLKSILRAPGSPF
jgi:hypothetical protein